MSDNQTPVSIVETDDDRMAFTQRVRRQLIEEMISNGMPADKADRMVLLAALDGMDRTSIANKKIGSQERQGAADRQAAILIAEMTRRFSLEGSPLEAANHRGDIIEERAIQLDTSRLPPLVLAPGETDVGISTRNYEEFMRDVDGENTPDSST